MNTIKITKLLQTLFLLLLSGLLYCCTDDRDSYSTTPDYGKEKMVNFSVRLPGSRTPATRALGENDENEVKTIEILLFDNNGNYIYQPLYSNTITTDTEDSKIKTFSVKIPEGTYNMVMLANARQALTDALSLINIGDTKASVMSKLLISNSTKWNTNVGSNGYIPIPMWGELTSLAVNSSMAANTPVILARMLSKIDVALTTTKATTNFKLESVYLYNYNNQGSIAPVASNWNAVQNIAIAPSIPSTAQKPTNPTQTPLIYLGTSITTTDVSCVGEIFTFEAAAGSASSMQTNTCLVIGGTYTGDSQATYYRVDFANTTAGVTTYLPLLRNHSYKINITDISGSGLSTPADVLAKSTR